MIVFCIAFHTFAIFGRFLLTTIEIFDRELFVSLTSDKRSIFQSLIRLIKL